MINGWDEIPFAEFATLQRGADLPLHKRRQGPYPVLASNGIVGSHEVPLVSGPGVVTGRSGTIGKPTFIDVPYWPLNTVLWVNNFHGNNPKFVYFFFQFFDFGSYATGTSVPTLNRNFVHSVLICVPPRPEQEKIAAVLWKIQSSIELEDKLVKTARELKRFVMRQLFGQGLHGESLRETQIGPIPQSWEIKTVDDIFACFDGERIPVKQSERKSGPYPYYGASGVVDYVDSYLFDGEYLLIAEDGENLDTRKLPIAFIASGKFWVNNHAHVLKNRCGSLKFYEQFITQLDIRDYITGTTRPKLTKGLLMQISLPFPNEDEQTEIARILTALSKKIEVHERKRAMLLELFNTTLRELMTGHIRVDKIDIDVSEVQS